MDSGISYLLGPPLPGPNPTCAPAGRFQELSPQPPTHCHSKLQAGGEVEFDSLNRQQKAVLLGIFPWEREASREHLEELE